MNKRQYSVIYNRRGFLNGAPYGRNDRISLVPAQYFYLVEIEVRIEGGGWKDLPI